MPDKVRYSPLLYIAFVIELNTEYMFDNGMQLRRDIPILQGRKRNNKISVRQL